jgi:methylase of polypeptide subunit release factors
MLKPLSPQDAQRLREFLGEANYTHEEFQSRQTLLEVPSIASHNLPFLLDGTREPSVLNLLLRWFYLGVPSEGELAASLIAGPALSLMLESGMLTRDGSVLAPVIMLTPCDGFLFAADTAARMALQAPDLVIWPNPTTRLLNQFTIRKPVRATLDLGTGCGIQAVLAANHSQLVTATDLNPRAAEFTLFNARLNGVENIECLAGDTFAPVRNRTFDLITANPPFFITPSSDQIYCENGMELDGYCRRVAREAPDHLNEGGYLQMVFECVQVRGQSWRNRVLEWIDGTGCDVWIFHSYARDALAYAWERIRQTVPAAEVEESLPHWMDYYRQRGVEEIHGGILAMRRRTGRNWVRIEDMPLDPNQPFGEAVGKAFASIDLLELHGSDEELLGARLRLCPDTQIDQRLRQSEGRWQAAGMTLRFTNGIPASMRLDPPVAEFLARLDGRRSLHELIQDLAQEARIDPQVVQRECLLVVRRLIERRFLDP